MTDKTDYGEPLRTEYNERTKRWEVKSADDTIGFVYCGIDERFRIERYIACVNACAGIPTEELKHYLSIANAHRNTDQAIYANAMSQGELNAMVERGEVVEGEIYLVADPD